MLEEIIGIRATSDLTTDAKAKARRRKAPRHPASEAMGRLSRQQTDWRGLAADALLSRARQIAEGGDDWTDPELRAAFIARVAAGEDPLGDKYTATHTAQERRGAGVTLTPVSIVNAMIGWAEKEAMALGRPVRILDPGAGTGRFAIAAARTFPTARVVAVENDPSMLILLHANLRVTGLRNQVEVIERDFREISLAPANGPTLFLGNPPYVRHHDISPAWKRWYVDVCAKRGIKASQLAGLHLHFFAKAAELGKVGDYGCFITAAEWLDVGYGAALRSLLADGLGGAEIQIAEPTAEVFPGTMTTSVVTGFRIGQRPPQLCVRSVRKASDLDRLEGGRMVAWDTALATPKWSILVRETPQLPPGTIELGELCRVHRGQVTGANHVWIAGKHTSGIPAQFLKPTVTRAEQLIAAEPILKDDRHLARVVDLPADLGSVGNSARIQLESFIAWAHAAGAADGYIARHRKPWWAIRLGRPAPIVCTYMARRIPAFVRNLASACLLNIAHGIYPREAFSDEDLIRLITALRASVRQEHGRTYSGGLTKFEPREIERIPISWPQ